MPAFPSWMHPHHARIAFGLQRVRGGSLVDNYRLVVDQPLPAGELRTYAQWDAELGDALRLERIAPQEAEI